MSFVVGFENTVTAGVVSAWGCWLPDDSAVPFIQTDVPINPQTQGGPLFNSPGEVMGINSPIRSCSGGYQGVSFAIPSHIADKIRDPIVTTGKVEHDVRRQTTKSGLLPAFLLRQVKTRPCLVTCK